MSWKSWQILPDASFTRGEGSFLSHWQFNPASSSPWACSKLKFYGFKPFFHQAGWKNKEGNHFCVQDQYLHCTWLSLGKVEFHCILYFLPLFEKKKLCSLISPSCCQLLHARWVRTITLFTFNSLRCTCLCLKEFSFKRNNEMFYYSTSSVRNCDGGEATTKGPWTSLQWLRSVSIDVSRD